MTDSTSTGLTITRTYAAPRELVWAAWTRPEHFSVWFGTEAVDVPVESVSMDVRVGGSWNADMHLPDGHVIHWVGEFVEVDPPRHLVFTMTDDPTSPAREPVSVHLADVDPGDVHAGTEMTMTQTGGNLTPEQYAQARAGYQGFFDAMARLLAAQV